MVKIYREKYYKKHAGSINNRNNNQNSYIYEAIKNIPFGKVISFQKLAYRIGNGITSNVVNTAIRNCMNF